MPCEVITPPRRRSTAGPDLDPRRRLGHRDLAPPRARSPAGGWPPARGASSSPSTTAWPPSTRSRPRSTTATAAIALGRRARGRVGGDPARVAVGGDSAGGNLGAAVATRRATRASRRRFQLLVYPATDLTVLALRRIDRERATATSSPRRRWSGSRATTSDGADAEGPPLHRRSTPTIRPRRSRRRSSSPPSSTRCATRARPTPPG